MARGTGKPSGRLNPSAQRTRIVSKPERKLGFPSGLRGVGVVDLLREAAAALRFVAEDFLLRSHSMEETKCGWNLEGPRAQGQTIDLRRAEKSDIHVYRWLLATHA